MIWRHARIVIKLYVAFCGASVLVLVCWENEFACWVKEFFLSLLLLFRAQLACHGWWWKWWIRSLRVHLQPRKRYAKTYILGKLNTTTTIFSWLLILPSCCLYSASCGLCRTWSSDKVLQPLKLSVMFFSWGVHRAIAPTTNVYKNVSTPWEILPQIYFLDEHNKIRINACKDRAIQHNGIRGLRSNSGFSCCCCM